MHEYEPTSDRFLRRVAEGVWRSRLVDPIHAARPPLVVVSAPSGYGKTVLGAQLAVSGSYSSTHWVDSPGRRRTVAHALSSLLERLAGGEGDRIGWSLEDVLASCVDEFRTLPGDRPVLIVLDDLDGDGISTDVIAGVGAVAKETPAGSTVMVITRDLAPQCWLPGGAWLLDADMLRLDEREAAEIWQLHHGIGAEQGHSGLLAELSGCHAALASLIARRAALLGGAAGHVGHDSLSAELIRSMASTQLQPSELTVLHVAAVAGEGTEALLAATTGNREVGSALVRIAEVLPLVTCTDSGSRHMFAVSDLVASALGGAKALVDANAPVAERLVRELAREGRREQAMIVAVQTEEVSLITATLHEVGSQLVSGQSAELVADALELLPKTSISCDARLLMLVAESEWHRGEPAHAMRTARLALELARNSDDEHLALKSRLALARFRWSMGDFEGIVDEVAPLISRWSAVDDLDDVCSLLTSAEIAYAFAGDRAGLISCQHIEQELRDSSAIGKSAIARIDEVAGIVASLLDGDSLGAVSRLGLAAGCRNLSVSRRLSVLNNRASLALMAGQIDDAIKAADAGLSLASQRPSGRATTASLNSVLTIAHSVRSAETGVQSVLDDAVEAESNDGDRFGLTSALVFAALGALAVGKGAAALSYAERVVPASVETRSPVLRWLAELIHAMCCLAVDDTERARTTATRVLPQVEAISAMGHVLHARMILAEVAMRDEDLSEAVRHLSEVSAHIIDTSPAFVVACYLRTFPDLLGPLALAMGVDAVPSRVLNLLNGEYERDALAAAGAVLTKPELRRLHARTRQEAERAAVRERTARDETAICEVRLLGGFEVKAPHGIVADRDWVKRKARLLFAILVARSGTDIARGEIIDHLWPDMDEERGLSNFYVVWSAMKRALSPGGSRDHASPFVEHNRGVCRVVPGRVVSDLDSFKAALGQARTAHAAGDPRGELSALLEALRVYRGDVLPGDVYDDWFGPIRERFKQDYEDTALRVGRLYADSGELLEGLSVLRDVCARNPWREDIYQAILRLQIASGQRAAAIETYFMCRSRLVEDLGIDPSRETTALYEEVLGMDEHAS